MPDNQIANQTIQTNNLLSFLVSHKVRTFAAKLGFEAQRLFFVPIWKQTLPLKLATGGSPNV